jgi:hypothetical protein
VSPKVWKRAHWSRRSDGQPVGKPVYVWCEPDMEPLAVIAEAGRIMRRLTARKYGLDRIEEAS